MEFKLYCGDCLELMSNIEDNSVDCVICDLPYFKVVENDFDVQWKTLFDYLDWVNTCLIQVKRILKENGNVLLFCSRQNIWRISKLLDELGFIENRLIIWARKRGFNTTRGNALSSGYEPILFWSLGEVKIFNTIKVHPNTNRKEYTTGVLSNGINLSDVWDDIPALPHNSKEKVAHPTQKPVMLMERLVELFSNGGDTVLDFCMGSGSTGVACKYLNRKFIGIEKDETYYKIAEKCLNDLNSSYMF